MLGASSNPMTSLVGRDREIAEVVALLGSSRLVTLTGPGGTGKTRLAVAVAQRVRQQGIPVTFVDLSSWQDATTVPTAIATRARTPRDGENLLPSSSSPTRIADERQVLELDNMEHLLPAATLIADLLGRCSGLSILVTSRVGLRLSAEVPFEVPPLAIPDDDREPGALGRSPAVELFVERAQAAAPGLAITATDMHLVSAICRRVGGLPLAIELAAARTRHLPLETVSSRGSMTPCRSWREDRSMPLSVIGRCATRSPGASGCWTAGPRSYSAARACSPGASVSRPHTPWPALAPTRRTARHSIS